ncbi:MAG: hypothetical protein QW270_02400 [Candidatus Bathyarchaeia archaeon]
MVRKTTNSLILTIILIGTLTLAVGVQPADQAFASSVKGTSLLFNGGFELWSGTPLLPDG